MRPAYMGHGRPDREAETGVLGVVRAGASPGVGWLTAARPSVDATVERAGGTAAGASREVTARTRSVTASRARSAARSSVASRPARGERRRRGPAQRAEAATRAETRATLSMVA